MKRFFAPGLSSLDAESVVTLPDAEAHHLRDVLRVNSGDTVELFDGEGSGALAVVSAICRKEVQLRLFTLPVRQQSATPRLCLAVAAPKADRLRWLVEKIAELDVDELTPLVTARTVVKPGSGKLARLEDAALQACKQCGRNQLPVIQPLASWHDFWESIGIVSDRCMVLIADREGGAIRNSLEAHPGSPPERVVVLIGPEGGFTADELSAAHRSGAEPISLGKHILRVETAAVAAATFIRNWFGAGGGSTSIADQRR